MAESLNRELAAVALEYRLTKEELAFLQAKLADEVASFKKERDLLIAAHTEELDILRDQHLDLESRYNRLVRPARSTVGRFVVEVRFWKDGPVRQYSLRESGGSEEIISESDLYAGLRTSDDDIEAEGVRRARETIEAADLVLCVLDDSDPASSRFELYSEIGRTVKQITVFNKSDLRSPSNFDFNRALACLADPPAESPSTR